MVCFDADSEGLKHMHTIISTQQFVLREGISYKWISLQGTSAKQYFPINIIIIQTYTNYFVQTAVTELLSEQTWEIPCP